MNGLLRNFDSKKKLAKLNWYRRAKMSRKINSRVEYFSLEKVEKAVQIFLKLKQFIWRRK